MWAKVENGSIVASRGTRPNWLNDQGQPVSDAVLKQEGWLPVENETKPTIDEFSQRLTIQPVNQATIETNRVVRSYVVNDITLEELKSRYKQVADQNKDATLVGGVDHTVNSTTYTFSSTDQSLSRLDFARQGTTNRRWRTQTGDWVELTPSQLEAIFQKAVDQVETAFSTLEQDEIAIDNAASISDLKTVAQNRGLIG